MIERPDRKPDVLRIKVLFAVIAAVLVVIVFRLWFLQIVRGAELAEQADTQRMRLIRRPAARGAILDAQGRPLATTRPQFVISIIPDEARKNPATYTKLAAILKISEADLREQIDDIRNDNHLAPSDPAPLVKDAPVELMSLVEEQRVDLPGVLITRDPVRLYVDNMVCTHVLGIARPINADELKRLNDQNLNYRGGDIIGKEGLEKTYEQELRGKDGGQWIDVNARGRIQHLLDQTPPVPGHTLKLTIDGDLQRVAYDALQQPLKDGHAGSAVALDPNTGAVLALASAPSYDANTYSQKFNELRSNPLAPLINRATDSGYPCGSTFKLVTSAAGLENGVISSYSYIYCPGFLKVGNRTFHCDKLSGHGSLSLADAIAKSCDVYYYRVGQMLGHEKLANMAHQFGLGQKTGIDLPPGMDNSGLIPTPEWKKKTRRGPWVPGDLINMSIGQGAILVTPLQLANYTAALANGGDLLVPHLVGEIDDATTGRPIRKIERTVKQPLGITEANRRSIINGMRKVFEEGGTGHVLAIPGLDAAGKTGSAQMIFHGHHRTNSVFVCFAPIDHPRIAVAVLVEGAGYGMEVAGPIARRMVAQYLHINVKPVEMHVGRIHGGD